ncbi:MAG TPA: hypothetical protein VNG89_14795, partial [Vicinamibacterales bacterium]|nr:hypothetical protein [Vicinamibacterales bacterium]
RSPGFQQRGRFGRECAGTIFGDRAEQPDSALRDQASVAVNHPDRPIGSERLVDDPLLLQKAAIEPEQRRRRSTVRGKVLGAANASIPERTTHVLQS